MLVYPKSDRWQYCLGPHLKPESVSPKLTWDQGPSSPRLLRPLKSRSKTDGDHIHRKTKSYLMTLSRRTVSPPFNPSVAAHRRWVFLIRRKTPRHDSFDFLWRYRKGWFKVHCDDTLSTGDFNWISKPHILQKFIWTFKFFSYISTVFWSFQFIHLCEDSTIRVYEVWKKKINLEEYLNVNTKVFTILMDQKTIKSRDKVMSLKSLFSKQMT